MTEREIKEMAKLDEAAERAGGYVARSFDPNTQYDYRKLLSYCKEKGIEPLDLTLREVRKFVIQ